MDFKKAQNTQYDQQLKATETLDSHSMTEIRRRRFPSVMITDTVFADDIALILDNLDKAQSLPERKTRPNTWHITSEDRATLLPWTMQS